MSELYFPNKVVDLLSSKPVILLGYRCAGFDELKLFELCPFLLRGRCVILISPFGRAAKLCLGLGSHSPLCVVGVTPRVLHVGLGHHVHIHALLGTWE